MAEFVEADQSDFPCPVLFRKIFPFPPDPNHFYIPRRLVPHEGRIAIVTDAGRDAVDADGAADESAGSRTAKSCGPGASTLASSLRLSASDGDKKARSPGRARRKPLKPVACGNAGCSGATVVNNSCAFYLRTRGCGCSGHPAFPTPSVSWAYDSFRTRAIGPRGRGGTSEIESRHCEPTGRRKAPPDDMLREAIHLAA